MIDKNDVLARLTPEAVAAQYGIAGTWSGRWLRSRRCPQAEHGQAAFGLSREGKWHCHACNTGGGDLLSMIALFEGLDCARDFQAVLETAGSICGLEADPADFDAAPLRKPQPRPVAPALPPLAERLAIARARAEWVWSHLKSPDQVERVQTTGRHPFLADRALPWRELPAEARINVRELCFWTVPGDYEQLWKVCTTPGDKEPQRTADTIKRIYSSPDCAGGVALAVRHVETGSVVDVRARRAEVAPGQPKVMGLPGGLTVHNGELVACYGNPHALDRDRVVVVEGWADYLTAALRWPAADVLGAVDAGSYPLVAGFAARYLAERGSGMLVLVAQHDEKVLEEQRGDDFEIKHRVVKAGAAERALAAALKRAFTLIGGARVRVIAMRDFGVKDLNDLAMAKRLGDLPDH